MNEITLALFALLQLADAWTTVRVLDQGGKELWWPTAWLMARIGVVPALVVEKSLAVAFAAYLAQHAHAELFGSLVPMSWILGAMCAPYGWVVGHNAGQIRR